MKTFTKEFLQVLKKEKKEANILVVSHKNPDGDAHASSLAMQLALNEMGYWNVYVHMPNWLEKFNDLAGFGDINKDSKDLPQEFNLVIILDTPTKSRLDCELNIDDVKKIVIDHHDTEEDDFGDIKYIDSNASSTCEILFYMFQKLKLKITKPIAICLYTGILSDTDLIKSRMKTKKTFKALAKMFEKVNHVNHEEIVNLLSKVSERELLQKKSVLKNAQFYEDKNCIISYVGINTLSKEELNGKIDTKLLIRDLQEFDAEIKVLIIPSNDGVRISFRSNSKDILPLCNKFGGGGHKTSAGTMLYLKGRTFFTKTGEKVCDAKMQTLISEILEAID